MIWWTGLAPWEFEFPFPDSLRSTILGQEQEVLLGLFSANKLGVVYAWQAGPGLVFVYSGMLADIFRG